MSVIWVSALIMLLGFVFIFFGSNYTIVAGAILVGAGLITIGILTTGLNRIPPESEDDLDLSNRGNGYQKEIKLNNGKFLQIIKDFGFAGNTEVRIEDEIPQDGFYLLSETPLAYKVSDGKIKMEYYIEKFKQEDGSVIEIGGSRTNGIGKNSPVWIQGNLVSDGEYKKGRKKILVVNGVIEKN